ncbi:Hypothetical predicted protein, partial [Paramuricea clavata]
MEELQRLRASRKAYRAHLTTLYKKIIELKSATTIDELHIATLENYCQQLKRKKDILSPLDEQIAKAITKPEDLECEIFETEEMHSTIDERYSELTTFIEIKRNELKLKVTVQSSNNTNESSPETSPQSEQPIQQENIHQPEMSQSPVGPNSETGETPASNNTIQNQTLINNNNGASASGSYPSKAPIKDPPERANEEQGEKSVHTTLIPAAPTSIVNTQGNETTICLLKTAISTVSLANQRAVANRAQCSFITRELADKLHACPQQTKDIQISTFGGEQPTSHTLETVTINIESITSEKIPVSVLVVPKIATPLQNRIRTNVRTLPYLKGIPLAHPITSDEKFEVSLLIGANYYWEIVQDHIIRGAGPTAMESKLGYLLSGPLPLGEAPSNTTILNVITMPHHQ